MTSDLDALVAFLRARLDEDGRDVKRADHPDGHDSSAYCSIWSGGPCDCGTDNQAALTVDAQRRIVDQYVTIRARAAGKPLALGSALERGAAAGLEYAVRCLASPHSAHPDYREEWRP